MKPQTPKLPRTDKVRSPIPPASRNRPGAGPHRQGRPRGVEKRRAISESRD